MDGKGGAPPKRLLVPVDDAKITSDVLSWAAFLAGRFGADAKAIHVVSSVVLSSVLSAAAIASGAAVVEDHDVMGRVVVRDDTQRWMRTLLASGAVREPIDSEVAFGDPAREILATAEREGTDLIVMGSRGAGAVRRFITGSVVGGVLRGARCPVLVVRPGAARASDESKAEGEDEAMHEGEPAVAGAPAGADASAGSRFGKGDDVC